MSKLLEMVQDAPLYRRGGKDLALGRRPVVIYCLRKEAAAALAAFEKGLNTKPAYLCLHDKPGDPAENHGVPLLSPDELADRPDLLPWVYGKSERAKGILLAQKGVRDFVFAKDPPYRDSRYQPDLLATRRDELERLFAMLADEESRVTLASVIKQRLRGEHGFLRIARYPEYSHPLVKALPGDHVIDAGAFDGRTALAFARQAVGGKVWAFEPETANQERVRKLLQDALEGSDKRLAEAAGIVELVGNALYDKDAVLRFSSDKGSSGITGQDADIEVQATSVDNFVQRTGVTRLDLVSLDVEGVEPQVLAGMVESIRRFRPKLQISIYHHKDHLYSLPFLVQSLCPDYAFFLGHHNTYSTETDLYAVPIEKLPKGS